ncbi:MAG TPA: hypothetical protein V6C58_20825 [Allocoleopsis sp.]
MTFSPDEILITVKLPLLVPVFNNSLHQANIRNLVSIDKIM